MLQCVSCGSNEPDEVLVCTKCHATLATSAVALSETIAIPPPLLATSPSSRRVINSSNPTHISSIPAVEEERFLPGTLIGGRYRIIQLLGRGGMGEVYRATDLALAQSIALKFLTGETAANERLLERFHSEVRIARQVSHPNVCRVYDIGEADGMPFISMEYVDGEDLDSLFRRIGRLPADKALEIARKLCAGLAAAHERGIIHRDLKPQNIMLDKRGQIVIMDFGLAAVTGKLTGPEARNGTPAYMSPEQLRGDSVTIQSDLYALGLIFYELFTGKRAFEAGSVAELLRLQETSRPVSMTSLAADIDPAVEKVILRCLRVDPAERPRDALAVAAGLPGGDPLAAALAAGETPSPQLVAASGSTQGFKLRYAVPCLVFVLLTLLSYPFLFQPISMLALTPMEFPPSVLQQKARDIATSFGYSQKPADWMSWLRVDSELVDYLKDKQIPGKNWKQLFEAAPPIQFRYRQSPDDLASDLDGEITVNRPAPIHSGMVYVLLDTRGRLREFRAVAPQYAAPLTAPVEQLDPGPVFLRAGLDQSKFQEMTPEFAPVLPFDARRAWKGQYPGLPDTPVVVEIASWRGVITSLNIRWPWTNASNRPASSAVPSQLFFEIFSVLFLATGLFCAIFFARRNLNSGRGDRKGAFRMAGALILLFLGAWLPELHPLPNMKMVGYITNPVGFPLMIAGLFWLIYIAIEPAVRSRWPHSLITWNRLLAGQFMDSRLGSHILTGVVIGLAMRCIFLWRFHWTMAQGGPPDDTNLNVLFGFGRLTSTFSNTMFSAVVTSIIIFFILTGLRTLVRRDWVAAIVAAVLLVLQDSSVRASTHPFVDVPSTAESTRCLP